MDYDSDLLAGIIFILLCLGVVLALPLADDEKDDENGPASW
jgi:hypothetical protein